MNKRADKNTPVMKDGFYLIVDGRQYGPFLEKHRDDFSDLKGRKGVEFRTVRQKQGWVEPPKKEKRPKPQSGLLFDTAPYSANLRGKGKGWM